MKTINIRKKIEAFQNQTYFGNLLQPLDSVSIWTWLIQMYHVTSHDENVPIQCFKSGSRDLNATLNPQNLISTPVSFGFAANRFQILLFPGIFSVQFFPDMVSKYTVSSSKDGFETDIWYQMVYQIILSSFKIVVSMQNRLKSAIIFRVHF